MAEAQFEYTNYHLSTIRKFPHLLGHIAGKTKLNYLHSYWVRYIWDTLEESCLQAHRGSYKTTAVTTIGPVWWLLFNPDDRIGILRKSFTQAAATVAEIKHIFQMPEIQALFEFAHGFAPRFKVNREGKLLLNFKHTATKELSIEACGLDTGLTGSHYDKFMGDDFITLKDRISKAERTKTIEILREIRANIMEHGMTANWTGTPWHKFDGWSVLPEPEKFDIYTCGILDKKEIERKKTLTTPSLYAANYELRHANDEGALFTDPVYGKWQAAPASIYAQLDAAYDGDHTCALTIMGRRKDGKLQGYGAVYPGNVKDWIPFVARKHKQFKAKMIYNESNPDKGYTATELRKRGLSVHSYPESQNKHIKISTYLYEVWKDIIWDDRTDDEYMEQILDYREKQEPDDAPDSAASLVRAVFSSKSDKGSLWRLH